MRAAPRRDAARTGSTSFPEDRVGDVVVPRGSRAPGGADAL